MLSIDRGTLYNRAWGTSLPPPIFETGKLPAGIPSNPYLNLYRPPPSLPIDLMLLLR